jgi:hypothetical protein
MGGRPAGPGGPGKLSRKDRPTRLGRAARTGPYRDRSRKNRRGSCRPGVKYSASRESIVFSNRLAPLRGEAPILYILDLMSAFSAIWGNQL